MKKYLRLLANLNSALVHSLKNLGNGHSPNRVKRIEALITKVENKLDKGEQTTMRLKSSNQIRIELILAGNLGEAFRLSIPMLNDQGIASFNKAKRLGLASDIENFPFDWDHFTEKKHLLHFELGNKAIDLPASAEELMPYLAHEVNVNVDLQDGDEFIYENNAIARIENGILSPIACHLWDRYGDRYENDHVSDRFIPSDDSFANDDPFVRSQLGYDLGHKRLF